MRDAAGGAAASSAVGADVGITTEAAQGTSRAEAALESGAEAAGSGDAGEGSAAAAEAEEEGEEAETLD